MKLIFVVKILKIIRRKLIKKYNEQDERERERERERENMLI